MALEFKDRAGDLTVTTGTGTLTLDGSAPTGLRTFSAAGFSSGATIDYLIINADKSEWEVGQGVWTSSGNTLTRATVFASSNANALVNFSAGTKTVTAVAVAARAQTITHALNKLSVRSTSTANVTGAGWEKYPFDTVDYDTGGMWNAANTRVQPMVAGYYQFHIMVAAAAGTAMRAGVRKNGGTISFVGEGFAGSTEHVGGSVMLYMNGTTDYAEGMIWINAVRARINTVGEQFFQAVGPL